MRSSRSILLALTLLACSQSPDEARLRDTIAAMEAAVEARNPADFIVYVADDFSGQSGQLDRHQLRSLLAAQFLRHSDITVLTGPLDIRWFGDRATVKMDVLATGGRWFPETGRRFALESHWRFEGGRWICFRADWQ